MSWAPRLNACLYQCPRPPHHRPSPPLAPTPLAPVHELWACERVYHGVRTSELLRAVLAQSFRPPQLRDMPPRYARLMQGCWDASPMNR